MSSYVRDHVLTSRELHRTYDTLKNTKGLSQTQALIEGAMAAMEELIWLRDKNGNFKELTPNDIPLIRSILEKHLGSRANEVWNYWTKGAGENTRSFSDFKAALSEFNSRRKFVMDDHGKLIREGHQDFLKTKFLTFYNTDFAKLTKLNPELFLGSKSDFSFMNIVFINHHKFDLSNL